MPGIFYEPVNRRSFLKSTALGSIGLALGGCASAPRTTTQAPKEFHLALLSDTHIPGDRLNGYRGFNPWENLKRIVPEVVAAKPEAVILNGDAARLEGLPADYAEVKSLLQPVAAIAPVYITLGNHDDRPNFLKAIQAPEGVKQNVKDRLVLVVDHSSVRIIILDSLLFTNKSPGLLGKEQRTWLEKYLPANAGKPTVLFVHHTLKDSDGDLLDAERLFEIIRPQKHVKAIFYGHSHVWEIAEKQGVKLINLPAVGYNFADKEPVGWVDARFDPSGVNLAMHAFGGNRADDGKNFRVLWA